MVANGYDRKTLPVKLWGLRELTLLAFYYHPDLDVARARLDIAKAAVVTAGRHLNPGVQFFIEHHGIAPNQSPWTRGLSLDLPVVTAGKYAARIEQAELLVEVENINLSNTAWQVRSRVRSRLLDYYAAREKLRLLESEVGTRSEAVSMLERRLAGGMVSVVELGNERIKLADAQRASERQRAVADEAKTSMAAAVGLTSDKYDQLMLSYSELEQSADLTNPKDAQRLALANRLDIQRGLLDYAVAESALKLEIARQYPDFSIGPGYRWDQGDNVWSLGIALLLPVLNRNEGPILEAKARRELEARNFLSLQAKVITETEASITRFQRARTELAIAKKLRKSAQERYAQTGRRFELGYADRLEKTSGALELLAAERSELSARSNAARAQGLLEDALQRPLDKSSQLVMRIDTRAGSQALAAQPEGRP